MIKRYPESFKFLCLIWIFAFILCGCGRRESANKSEVIAYVNKEPIFVSDLRREVILKSRMDPTFKVSPETEAEQIDTIINRKLIIQDALKKGLAGEERFIQMIKVYWEQALIKEFIDYKKRECRDCFFASENEIKKYYGNLSASVTFKVLKSKDKKYIDGQYAKFLSNHDREAVPWETVGPVGYEDIESGVLLDAFNMPPGEVKIFEDQPYYYLVLTEYREVRPTEPLEKLKGDIENRIIQLKEKRVFDDWLKEARQRASIKYIIKK